MSDPLKKMARNERLRPGEGPFNAEFHNLAIEAIEDYLQRKNRFGAQEFELPKTNDMWLANISAALIDQFGVSGVGEPTNPPRAVSYKDPEQVWRNEDNWYTSAPAVGRPFAITLDPIPLAVNAIPFMGRATMTGPVKCKINIGAAGDLFAGPIAGDYTKLLSNPISGPASILWRDQPDAWVDRDYVIGDMVSIDGVYYTCSADHTGHQPPNSNYWTHGAVRWARVLLCQCGPTIVGSGSGSGSFVNVTCCPGVNIPRNLCMPLTPLSPGMACFAGKSIDLTYEGVVPPASGNGLLPGFIVEYFEPGSFVDRWSGTIVINGQTVEALLACGTSFSDPTVYVWAVQLYWVSHAQGFLVTAGTEVQPGILISCDPFHIQFSSEAGDGGMTCGLPGMLADPGGIQIDIIPGPCEGTNPPTVTRDTSTICNTAISFTIAGTHFTPTGTTVTLIDSTGATIANHVISVAGTISMLIGLDATPANGAMTAIVVNSNGSSAPAVQVGTVGPCGTPGWLDHFTGTNGTALTAHTPDASPGTGYTDLNSGLAIESNAAKSLASVGTNGVMFDPLITNSPSPAVGVIDFVFDGSGHTQTIMLNPRYGGSFSFQAYVVLISGTTWRVIVLSANEGISDSHDVTLNSGTTYTLTVTDNGTSVSATCNGVTSSISSVFDASQTKWSILVDASAAQTVALDNLAVSN